MAPFTEVPPIFKAIVPVAVHIKDRAVESSKHLEYLVCVLASNVTRHNHRVEVVCFQRPKFTDGVDVVVDVGTRENFHPIMTCQIGVSSGLSQNSD